tara:strand:- start:65 stop:451 length:387 start_codon:yes stop_codon:yes gene_type:complete
MATNTSSQGLIKIGSDTLGELKSFSFSETAGTIETSNLSSTAKTFAVGQTSFSGSAEAFWDNADNAQNALSNGAIVTIHFYPQGEATSDKYRSGTVIVSEISTSLSVEGMVEASFSFTGSGALAEATV